jgi:hypothetical protein
MRHKWHGFCLDRKLATDVHIELGGEGAEMMEGHKTGVCLGPEGILDVSSFIASVQFKMNS